ncbi:MAG: efflux RND transporter periplasmic adaptor subunit [Verrucomicrobia bacterium]|nr:efflux RND transporter periplasmic adaptor subunit [Verrucomicrobiota bacterium]
MILRSAPVFVFALLVSSCHRPEEASPAQELPTVPVRVSNIEIKPHATSEDVVGTVRAKLAARVESKINGRIAQLLAAPGQVVKSGELLLVIDAAEIQAKLEQANAMLAQAQKDFDRLKPLLASNAISRQDFDAADARLRVAKSSVAEAETMLGYIKITASFDGVITRKIADVGDFAMPGKPLLEMESPAVLRFEADVPEALIEHIKLNATLPVKLNPAAAVISGRVAEIAPITDPGSRTFLVKLDLPQAPGVRAGQFGRVQVPVGSSNTPLVPAASVSVNGQMEFVTVVSNGRAHLRIVKSGRRDDGKVEIISGLDAGEQIIIEGMAKDGQRVEVKP